MRKEYKEFSKSILLLCLLFVGVAQARGYQQWTGSKLSANFTPSSTGYAQIGTTTVYLKGSGITYNTSYRGIKIPAGQTAYLQAQSTNGVIKIIIEGDDNNTNNNDVTIKDGSNTIISTHVVKRSTSTGSGTGIAFEMERGTEYTIYSSKALYIKKVMFYLANEYLTLNETDSNDDNRTKIVEASNMTIVNTKRTLKAGQWNTFCLPSTVNNTDLNAILKCTAAYEMTSYDSGNHTITFSPIAGGAGNIYRTCTPCLLKPSEDVVNPVITNGSKPAINETNLTKTSNGLSFIGVFGVTNIYTTGDENSTKFYLNNSGGLVYPTSNSGTNGCIKGLRAYFEFAEGANAQELTLYFDNSETDGISFIERNVKLDDNRVYTLDGRFVGTTSDQLPRGVYIQNGQKFVVK